MGALSVQPAASGNRTMAIVAGASIAVSVAAVLARLLGMLPDGPATLVVIIGAAIALKVALSYAAKSASNATRTRVMNLVSTVALAISALTAVASLPRITKSAGMHVFLIDLCAQLWTLAILWIVAGPVRTIGWRAFVGSAFTGFLGITALARLVGTPLIEKLGTSNLLAAALWVPITEEALKLLPIALVLAMAMRRAQARPSAIDVMMLGAWTGAGFSLFENATLGRGAFSLSANPLLSLFFPSEGKGTAFGWTVAQTGHLVHTALIALAVAVALFYPKQLGRRWLGPAIAIGAVLIEHCSQNAMITGHLNVIVAKLAIIVTLGGRLTSILLLGGMAYVVMLEWRAARSAFTPKKWFPLSAAEAQRRGMLLATAGMKGGVSKSHASAGGAA